MEPGSASNRIALRDRGVRKVLMRKGRYAGFRAGVGPIVKTLRFGQGDRPVPSPVRGDVGFFVLDLENSRWLGARTILTNHVPNRFQSRARYRYSRFSNSMIFKITPKY